MISHCKRALISTFWKDWIFIAFVAILAECVGIYAAIYIQYLASFIMDKS